jgi:hypothetical protein
MKWLAECSAAALRLAREIGVLTVLGREPKVPFLPEVVASSTDPVLLITRRVPGTSLFDVVDSIDRDRAARQLGSFLAALHRPATRERAEGAVGTLTGAQLPPATTTTLRERLGKWIRPDQLRIIMGWCDWADAVLASPGPAVLVHGDLHGDNQVWHDDELRLVVDFETIGAAEPEYDLRTFPGPGMGPGVELLTALCAPPSVTCCGAAKPGSRWRTTGHHQSGSRTCPHASPHSPSAPKHPPPPTIADAISDVRPACSIPDARNQRPAAAQLQHAAVISVMPKLQVETFRAPIMIVASSSQIRPTSGHDHENRPARERTSASGVLHSSVGHTRRM